MKQQIYKTGFFSQDPGEGLIPLQGLEKGNAE
jgi:hypothetical protein